MITFSKENFMMLRSAKIVVGDISIKASFPWVTKTSVKLPLFLSG